MPVYTCTLGWDLTLFKQYHTLSLTQTILLILELAMPYLAPLRTLVH